MLTIYSLAQSTPEALTDFDLTSPELDFLSIPLALAPSDIHLEPSGTSLAPSGAPSAKPAAAKHPAHEERNTYWINMVAPSPEECRRVAARFALPEEHLLAALDSHERPRVEYDNGIALVIARTPLNPEDKAQAIPLTTCPIAIIQKPGLILTVCLHDDVAEHLLYRKIPCKAGSVEGRILLAALFRVSSTFIEHLRYMDEYLESLEKGLLKSMRNAEILTMLHLEKSMVYFLAALKGNASVLDKIRSGALDSLTHSMKDFLDDVVIENKQASDMAEIYSNIMGSINGSFASIVSNNLNKVMKVLTSLTIVFMVPSVIGALYGMNVMLPGAESPHAFQILCIACLALGGGLMLWLRKKDWM